LKVKALAEKPANSSKKLCSFIETNNFSGRRFFHFNCAAIFKKRPSKEF